MFALAVSTFYLRRSCDRVGRPGNPGRPAFGSVHGCWGGRCSDRHYRRGAGALRTKTHTGSDPVPRFSRRERPSSHPDERHSRGARREQCIGFGRHAGRPDRRHREGVAGEGASARLAAERATEAELEEMRQAVAGMHEALDDRQKFALADLRFHRAVAAASGNFVLSSFAAVIETALVCSTLLLPLEKLRLRSEAVALHQDLLDAIAARQPDVAGRLMFDMIGFGAKVGEPAGA